MSNSNELYSSVAGVIDSFMEEEACFSSLNVKNCLFRCGIFFSLAEVNAQVKSLYDSGYMDIDGNGNGYSRTSMEFNGNRFYVYHHMQDEYEYIEESFGEYGVEEDLEIAYLTYLENKHCSASDSE